MKKPSEFSVVFLSGLILIAFSSCQKSKPSVSSTLTVTLCELYENPANYEGKRITFSATVTRLSGGTYLYPTTTCMSGFRFVKLDSSAIQSSSLRELESSSVSSTGRKEFEADIVGIFDSKYAEGHDGFRFRIVPSEIKQRSPVKSGRPWALANTRLERTRHERASLLGCVGEPLKRSVGRLAGGPQERRK